MKDSHAAMADLAVHGCQRRHCEVGSTVRDVLVRVEVPDQKLVRWEMLVLAICMLARVACLGGRARCRRSLLGFALTLGGSLGRCRAFGGASVADAATTVPFGDSGIVFPVDQFAALVALDFSLASVGLEAVVTVPSLCTSLGSSVEPGCLAGLAQPDRVCGSCGLGSRYDRSKLQANYFHTRSHAVSILPMLSDLSEYGIDRCSDLQQHHF